MKKRIFVAVDISEHSRRKVAEHIAELNNKFHSVNVGWERAEKIHITLKFLGEMDDFQLEKLKGVIQKIAGKVSGFKLRISSNGVFPSPQNARILWLGVTGDIEILQKINSVLENECEKIGFKKEQRIYQPHLTIARIRDPKKANGLIENHLENKIEPVEFEVSEIIIYESKLQPTGSIYQKKESFNFSSP